MRKKFSVVAIIGLIIIIISLITWKSLAKQPVSTSTQSGEPIKVGFIGALTGEAAFYGESDKNSMELAVEEINAAGGINGQQLEVIYEDGKCNGKDAVAAAQKLINIDKVNIIFGGTCSGEVLAVAPLTEKDQVILFASFASSPVITKAGDYVFRNAVSDLDNGIATANLAYKNGSRKIASIAENTDYAAGFAKVFEKKFTELGGEIIFNDTFTSKTTDFRGLITKAMALNPEAIIISTQGESGALVLKQLKEAGYSGQLYGNAVLGDKKIIDLAEGGTEGLFYSDPAGLSTDNAKAKHFLEAYNAKYGQAPSLEFYSGARYDSVFLISQAIKEVGLNTDKIKDYLYNLSDFNGVLGNISFDDNGDVQGIKFTDYQIKDKNTIKL